MSSLPSGAEREFRSTVSLGPGEKRELQEVGESSARGRAAAGRGSLETPSPRAQAGELGPPPCLVLTLRGQHRAWGQGERSPGDWLGSRAR